MKVYDYVNYWIDNFDKQQWFPKEWDELKTELSQYKFHNVLEVGSGLGLFSKSLKESFDIELTGIDVIEGNPHLDKFIYGDITKLEIEKYDLILCCNILLHIKPHDIKQVIEKLVKNSRKLIVLDYVPENKVELHIHNFAHDYSAFGLKLIKRIDENRAILST